MDGFSGSYLCREIFLMQEQRFAYQHLPQGTFSEDEVTWEDEGRWLEISFIYERQNVLGSNQIAVWIEDMEGNYIKTVRVTSYTAADGWHIQVLFGGDIILLRPCALLRGNRYIG